MTDLTEQPGFDPKLYRDGMARYAGHVQVVTTEFEGVRRGVTVTAACSVSDNPPSLLVCLNSTNANNEIFVKSGIFAVNSLSAEHQDLAAGFAGLTGVAAENRFASAEWLTLATGAPVLSDAVVAFDCRITDVKQMSTHFVLFGEVQAVHLGPERDSLVYLGRGFRAL